METRKTGMNLLLIMLGAVAAVSPAWCGELGVYGGAIKNGTGDDSSYSWQMEYRDLACRYGGWSVSYLNEGHQGGDRRDGYITQLWGYVPLQGGKFSLAAGGGPYLFFNTVTRRSTEGYGDTHGVGVAASVDASMELTKRWLLHLRSNWMGTPGDDTISALGGVSYRFDPPAASSLSEGEYGSEITLMAGLTILNSLSSEHSNDVALEYRRHLFRYLDWTAGWLWEGSPGGLSRNGAVSQVWGVAPLVDDTFSVGIGAGLYAAFEHDENRDDRHVFSALMGLTARYKLSPRWIVRTTWYRVMTDYDRDTDVIVGGVGYAF